VKEIYMQAYFRTRNENKEMITCRYQNRCEEIEAPVEGQSPAKEKKMIIMDSNTAHNEQHHIKLMRRRVSYESDRNMS
jgi:hypothetical protein